MLVHELLLEASDIIEKNGWCRGSYKDENGCFCLLGAIFTAADNAKESVVLSEIALTSFLISNGFESIIEFNDKHARDKEHVQEILKVVAKNHFDCL